MFRQWLFSVVVGLLKCLIDSLQSDNTNGSITDHRCKHLHPSILSSGKNLDS